MMDKREKVIDAFRNCITEPKCKDCPWESCETYHQVFAIPKDLALEVMKMLVVQKDTRLVPRKPYHTKVAYKDNGEEGYWITDQCPECVERGELGIWDTLVDRPVKYCRRCGQALDWSEYDGRDQIDWDEYMRHVGERAKRFTNREGR